MFKKLTTSAGSLVGLFSATFLFSATGGVIDWDAVEIDVDSTSPIEVQQRWVPRADDFTRLEIRLSNPGDAAVVIQEIDITIPFTESVRDDLEVIYGSSCMGQRPLLRETVGEDGRFSYSYMFEMVRVAENDYIFAGSLSWRTFLPVLSVSEAAIHVQSDGDGKQLQPGESLFYEAIVVAQSTDWDAVLREFGKAIARENQIENVKDVEFTGWATWDYYSRLFMVEDVVDNMAALNELYPQANIIQLDGGWWTARGDYMSVRPDLPGGIKGMADRIRADGKIAGLHFDGFRADTSSEIYKTHPEYFLHDQDGEIIVRTRITPDREMNQVYFDFSHPGARAYIAACVEEMRQWGITYFKVDFMRYGLESEIKRTHPYVKSIRAHDPSLSGVERFRLGMQTIRDAIGKENYFLGCSAVFGPCIGFVDGMRTGGDIHPRYDAFPERVLANSGNYYLDGVVWSGDADYLVFRAAEDEDERVSQESHKHGGDMTLNEAGMWADYNKLYGHFRLNSDNLAILRPDRRELVREVLEWPSMERSIPVDLWESGADKADGFELILASEGGRIYLGVFNWADKAKAYDLSGFGLDSPVSLKGRHSQILKYEGTASFEQVLEQLKSR
jgi:alpha-galactosidase